MDDDQIWGTRKGWKIGDRSLSRRICELDTRDVEDRVSFVETVSILVGMKFRISCESFLERFLTRYGLNILSSFSE